MKTLFFLLIATVCQAQSGSFPLKAIEYKPVSTTFTETHIALAFNPKIPRQLDTLEVIRFLTLSTFPTKDRYCAFVANYRRYPVIKGMRFVEVMIFKKEYTFDEFEKLIWP